MNVFKRGVAAAAVAGAILQLGVAGPAAATTWVCQDLPVSTPGVVADLDGDGTADARLPAVTDVTLCAGAGVVFEDPVTIEREQCGGLGSCMRYFVSYRVTAYPEAGVAYCYTADGTQTCGSHELVHSHDPVEPGTMCIGYDLRGGDPCTEGDVE